MKCPTARPASLTQTENLGGPVAVAHGLNGTLPGQRWKPWPLTWRSPTQRLILFSGTAQTEPQGKSAVLGLNATKPNGQKTYGQKTHAPKRRALNPHAPNGTAASRRVNGSSEWAMTPPALS